MHSKYDVVVVGAGPAGSTLAYELANSGTAVLLVDKAVFPRQKPCGGGVTAKAAKLLDDILPRVAEQSIYDVDFASSGSSIFRGQHDRVVVYTVTRDKLDDLLLQKAAKAGADVAQGTTVARVNASGKSVDVVTDKGNFQGEFVIGADGGRSVVASSVGIENRDGFVGIETEVSVGDHDMARWKSLIVADVGWASRGYGWLFPKKDHLSIGIGARIDKARNLKSAYWQFLNSLNLGQYTVSNWSAGFIPMYKGKPKVVQGRIALVGDAAGLGDPLTGEGIGNALLSAQLAAPAIEKALSRGTPSLDAYQQAVEQVIAPEVETARFLSRIIFSMPKKILEVARLDGRIWNAGCALVRGETTYSGIKGRVGTIGGLYSMLRGRASKTPLDFSVP